MLIFGEETRVGGGIRIAEREGLEETLALGRDDDGGALDEAAVDEVRVRAGAACDRGVRRAADGVEGEEPRRAPLAEDRGAVLLENVLGERRVGVVARDEPEGVVDEEGAADDGAGAVAGDDGADAAVASEHVAVELRHRVLAGDDDAAKGTCADVVVVEDYLLEVASRRSGGR